MHLSSWYQLACHKYSVVLVYAPFILYLGLVAARSRVETNLVPLKTHSKLAYAHANAALN